MFYFLSSNQILHILHCNDGAWHHILNLHENERKRKNLQMIKRIVNCGIFLQDEINLITKGFEDLIEPEISYHPFLLTINNLSVWYFCLCTFVMSHVEIVWASRVKIHSIYLWDLTKTHSQYRWVLTTRLNNLVSWPI